MNGTGISRWRKEMNKNIKRERKIRRKKGDEEGKNESKRKRRPYHKI